MFCLTIFLSGLFNISSFSIRHRSQRYLPSKRPPTTTTPAKNEVGRISKQILGQINSTICEILKSNKWMSTINVINRLKKIESKSSHKFLMFGIKKFYPYIKEGLLIEALEFAK